MNDIYVVVADNDKTSPIIYQYHNDNGPLVFEQYTRVADLESVKKRAEKLSKKYGNCRIARLEFIDYEQNEE